MLLLEGESGISLHRAAGVGGCRNRGHAWIRDARCKSRRAELVIGGLKAWMIDEIRGIHSNLKVRRFPLWDTEGLAYG
jgi:hypothetical protein